MLLPYLLLIIINNDSNNTINDINSCIYIIINLLKMLLWQCKLGFCCIYPISLLLANLHFINLSLIKHLTMATEFNMKTCTIKVQNHSVWQPFVHRVADGEKQRVSTLRERWIQVLLGHEVSRSYGCIGAC